PTPVCGAGKDGARASPCSGSSGRSCPRRPRPPSRSPWSWSRRRRAPRTASARRAPTAPWCPRLCPCRPVYEGALTWQGGIRRLAEPAPVECPIGRRSDDRRRFALHVEEDGEGTADVHATLLGNERT